MTGPDPTVAVHGRLERGTWSVEIENLTIAAGTTAIVGPNGVGKTSLLRLIAGLDALTTGRARIGEVIVDEPSTSTFVPTDRRSVAMVFQDHRVFGHLRAVDDVAFPLRRRGVRRAEARHRALGFLERVGMAGQAETRGARLSGGQRQRVAVARALARDADVLLLDEPLASIDDASRATLRELFGTDAAPTVVWVTHDPTDAEMAESVIELDAVIGGAEPRSWFESTPRTP